MLWAARPTTPSSSVDLTKGHLLKKALGPQIQGTPCVSAPWLFICPTHLPHFFFHWTNMTDFLSMHNIPREAHPQARV